MSRKISTEAKIKALKDSIKLWEILAKPENFNLSKYQAMEILVKENPEYEETDWLHTCPCCELIQPIHDKPTACLQCPLYPNSYFGCQEDDSLYSEWQSAALKYKRSFAANAFLSFITERLSSFQKGLEN